MSLQRYNKKRKFDQTPEPEGKAGKKEKKRFVVQEHWARSRHFDFRLEEGGALKSWAVPKGVPEKKGIKRLAIATEDHPVDYLNFEGEIPEGQYGAGRVEIFDQGEYELLEKEAEKILFELKGEKLKGSYCLIKTKRGKDQWLIFKKGEENERV